MRRMILLIGWTCLMFASPDRHSDAAGPEVARYRVYIGTYANAPGRGIFLLELDATTGKLVPKGLAAQAANPWFLALHPSRRFLYAVGELDSFGGQKGGAVSSFAVDAASGTLRLLNQQPSGGQGPCFVTVDNAGKNALGANYNSGRVACLPIDAEGKLSAPSAEIQHEGSGPDKKRQAGPHAHSINLDAANRFAVAADLGLDKLL